MIIPRSLVLGQSAALAQVICVTYVSIKQMYCISCPLKLLQKFVKKNPLSPGEHVSTIASKTGTGKYAGSKSRVVAEICDAQGTCCQTSSDGRGLDNSKVVRQAGQTDVYTDTAILGSCSQKVVYILTLGEKKVIRLGCADLPLF